MISRTQYLEALKAMESAKQVIEQYEQQDNSNPYGIKPEDDLDLLTCVSRHTKNWLERHNETCTEGEELIYISDFLRMIYNHGLYKTRRKAGKYNYLLYLLRERGFGRNKSDEIFEYLLPFLKGKDVMIRN